MSLFMRLNLLIATTKNQTSLILKRRLRRPELSTTRLYLNQLNSILEAKNEVENEIKPKAIISYIDKLFSIYKGSIFTTGIDLDLTMETWKSYFTALKQSEVHLLLDQINKHQNYRELHQYLEENLDNLDKIFAKKELIRLFQMIIHLDNKSLSKTTLKLYNHHLYETDLSSLDLFDIFQLQNGYSANNTQHEFKRRTADLVRNYLFNNTANNSIIINEEDRNAFSVEQNDYDSIMMRQDLNNNFLYLKTRIIFKYLNYFTSDILQQVDDFFIDSLRLIESKHHLDSQDTNMYNVNIVSNLNTIRRMIRYRFKFVDKINFYKILNEYFNRNRLYFYNNMHLVNTKYSILHIIHDNKYSISNLDIEFLLDKFNKTLRNDKETNELKIYNFLSILSVYDYLLYLKSNYLSKVYYSQFITNSDAQYLSVLKMRHFVSYNHICQEMNGNQNNSYFIYTKLLRKMKEENAELCNLISSKYDQLLSTASIYSMYPLSKSILFILNVHNRPYFAMRHLQNVLSESLDQLTRRQRMLTTVVNTLVHVKNHRYYKWPMVSYLKKFLINNSFRLDRFSKSVIMEFIFSSPATIEDSFLDIKSSIIESFKSSNLDNCYLLVRGLSLNMKSLIKNHPDEMNKVYRVLFKRLTMQLMLPLVDLHDSTQEDEIKKRLVYNHRQLDKDSQVVDTMLSNQLCVDKQSFNRIHRTYVYSMFIFRNVVDYQFILNLNKIYNYVEHLDFSYLIKFIDDYMNRIEVRDDQLIATEMRYKNPFRQSHPFPLSEHNSINYGIEKVVQKFAWLSSLYHDIGFYNQQQMDILWCYLIVCFDFFNKNPPNDLIKHNLIVISILKIFSRFNYLDSDFYKSQNKLFTNLFETYFQKFQDEFTGIELVIIAKALISLNIFSQNVFMNFYEQKNIQDCIVNENESEIVVSGHALSRVSFSFFFLLSFIFF